MADFVLDRTGKQAGVHVGRVAVRATSSFDIQTPGAVVQGVSHRQCRIVQRGYGYAWPSTRLNPGKSFPVSSHNLPSRYRAEADSQPRG